MGVGGGLTEVVGEAKGTGLGALLAPSGIEDVDLESMLERESGRFAPPWFRPLTGGCDLPGADCFRTRRDAKGALVPAGGWASGGNGTAPSQSVSTSMTCPRSTGGEWVEGAEPCVALRCLGLLTSSPES